ncbi:MAG TPA: hypothetical protein VGK67_02705 [Myxococcales bacterium]|jgi:hypothetical protein
MNPKLRRIGWMLVASSLALSGLSACSFSSMFGAGAGLGFAGFVTAILLLLGTTATQTGCDLGPCLSPLRPPYDVGPCLSPDRQAFGPDSCLTTTAPNDADLGPCLSQSPPDGGVEACLSPEPPDATTEARDPSVPADRALAAADRQQVLESLQDRLPEDVKARLGLKKA